MTTINKINNADFINTLHQAHQKGYLLDTEILYDNELYHATLDALGLTDEVDTDHIQRQVQHFTKVVCEAFDDYDASILSVLVEHYGWSEALEIIDDERIFIYHGCHDMEDVAERFIGDMGDDYIKYVIKDNSFYIDEEKLLRDLYYGGDIQEFYYHYEKENALEEGYSEEEAQEIASNYEITKEDEENYLEMVLDGVEGDWLVNYFDYEAFGRDMEIEGFFYGYDGGIFEVMN